MSKLSYEELDKRVKELEKTLEDFKRVEEALHKSEKQYRLLVTGMTDGLGIHEKGKFTFVNDRLCTMLGYAPAEMIGRPVLDFHDEKGRKVVKKQFEKRARGHSEPYEVTWIRKDGKKISTIMSPTPLYNDKGEYTGSFAIVTDITERKESEEDLKKHRDNLEKIIEKRTMELSEMNRELEIQKTYLEELFNCAPEAIMLHNNEDKIVNVNEEFINLFGFSREELVGQPVNDVIVSEEYMEEAKSLSVKVINGESIHVETKRRRKDGTLVDVSIIGAPVIVDGKQIGDFGIYRDITQRKKAEEELKIQKIHLEELFNSAPEAIVLHDTNDIVMNINKEFTNIFGYTYDEAVGKPINKLIAPGNLRDEAEAFSSKVLNGERINVETKRRRKDGTLLDVSILGAPVMYRDEQIGVYGIYRDITEQKRSEEARIKAREEARMARDIQINLLPKSGMEIPGYKIAGKNLPALNVGGDYYDFFRLDEYRYAIGLGDVSGKGLPASLVMANLQATIRSQAFFCTSAKECLEKSNKLLFKSTDARTFVSFFYGILDIRRNTISYVNAGQNIPLLFAPGMKSLPLENRGIALGIREDAEYTEETIAINPGESLLIYTDGISEAMNDRMEEFGDERLVDIVEKYDDYSASDLVTIIIERIRIHFGGASQNDDITLIVLKRLKNAD